MDRRYDIVTFDCYGTLIDWESGISDAFLHAAREDGIDIRREEVLRAYAAKSASASALATRRAKQLPRHGADEPSASMTRG